MRRAASVLALVIAAGVAACGGSDSGDGGGDLQAAGPDGGRGHFGKEFVLDDGTGVTLNDPRVGTSDDRVVLQVDVRAESKGSRSGTTPSVAVVCAGNADEGAYFASSTLLMGQPVAAGSAEEGTYDLEVPAGAGNEEGPHCEAPAYVAVRSGTSEVREKAEVRVPIAPRLLADLNGGTTTN
jgi:hypothetical protein